MHDPSTATVLHIDADAFFPSVEQILEPKYRGRPLIVGGGHRGVVASASYEARAYGVHSAMPIYKARKLCPQGIFIKGNHEMYAHFSKKMFGIFQNYTPLMEVTSIDEGYLDLKGTEAMHRAAPPLIAERIMKEVRETLGLTVSIGLARNKSVAKVASARYKPRKLTWIWPGHEAEFLAPLPLRALPGIGPKTAPHLESMGFHTLGDLAQVPFETLWEKFGGYGIRLWEGARGEDHRPVASEPWQRRSLSEEKTFPIDIDSRELLWREATAMLRELCYRLRREPLHARTLTLKIRYADFQTFGHQATLEQASATATDFLPLLTTLFEKRDPRRRVRLIGIGLSHLQNEVQMSLFAEQRRRNTLDEHLDVLRQKYGSDVV